MCQDSPDVSGVNAAAVANAKVAQQALDWFTQEYANTAGDRKAAGDRANAVSDAQLAAMNFATDEAKRQSQRSQSTFEPLENKIVGDAQAFDTPGRRAEAAARATADVEGAFAGAQGAMQRDLRRQGGTLSSPRALALMNDASLNKTKVIAGATQQAVNNVEQQGYARKMDAVGLGKGVVGNQAVQQQLGTQAGNSAVGNSNAALGASMSGAGLMQQGFNTAIQGNQSAGNLYGQAANIQNQAGGADLGGIAQLGMAGKYIFSDKRVKKKTGKPADGDKALAEVNALPVEEGWQYAPEKGGIDDGGQPHTGPMAQKVRAVMGSKAAPGGKVIDAVTMQGKVLAAMQALTKRVSKLESRGQR